MDAARYARVRELFLAAEELSPQQQAAFLKIHVGDDAELLEEVLSLLGEHDADSARIEGERAVPVQPPSSPTVRSRQATPANESPVEQTTRGNRSGRTKQPRKGSQITKHGAQRTHAAPRQQDDPSTVDRAAGVRIWDDLARQQRRRTSGWIWLAALLPTALIGWWTYRQVDATIEESVRNELKGVVNSLALTTDQYLNSKAELVRSWSRQPRIQQSILNLVELADDDVAFPQLRQSPDHLQIRSQLQSLSGFDDVKYVVWNDSFITISSWLDDLADVGHPVHPSGAANLARVMAGQTVLFGPERLVHNTEGFVPETQRPVMAIIVPIRDQRDKVVAALLVRGIGLFEEFSRMFMEVTITGELDAYAVNASGVMVTDSPRAVTLATQGWLDLPEDRIAGELRIADPGEPLDPESAQQVHRAVCPLTIAAADVINGGSDVRTEPYRNYAGLSVVGAWRWNPNWKLGIILEREAARAFAPARIVRFGFIVLGSLLFLTAFVAAARIARTSTAQRAAVHPLSRYEVIEEIGSGGMGVVYRVRHRQLGRDTALKVLIGKRNTKEDRLRFDREARLAASLSNPHSVTIYDYGRSDDGEAFCVMEFLRGLTLHEVVTRSGPQSIGRVLYVIRQICEALAEAHGRQLLHRDIKPQNVMLSLDPSVGDWAVLFDYGLAKPLEPLADVYQTSETIWSGTPMYMAPERFRAPSLMDPRSDIYSVGCVAYYLLSGRPPFIESDPESLFALIISEQPISIELHRGEPLPDGVNEMVMRCMAKHPDDRFATIGELAEWIDRLRHQFPWNPSDAAQWWSQHGDPNGDPSGDLDDQDESSDETSGTPAAGPHETSY